MLFMLSSQMWSLCSSELLLKSWHEVENEVENECSRALTQFLQRNVNRRNGLPCSTYAWSVAYLLFLADVWSQSVSQRSVLHCEKKRPQIFGKRYINSVKIRKTHAIKTEQSRWLKLFRFLHVYSKSCTQVKSYTVSDVHHLFRRISRINRNCNSVSDTMQY